MRSTKPRSRRATPRDTYFDLVQELPLKKLRDDDEHAEAAAMISKLIGRSLDTGAGDYLDALIVLVNNYEDEHHSIDDEISPRDALRALMQSNRLSQADIGRLIGSESAVSMFLKGTRSLSKQQIKVLSNRFRVDPTVFMD